MSVSADLVYSTNRQTLRIFRQLSFKKNDEATNTFYFFGAIHAFGLYMTNCPSSKKKRRQLNKNLKLMRELEGKKHQFSFS